MTIKKYPMINKRNKKEFHIANRIGFFSKALFCLLSLVILGCMSLRAQTTILYLEDFKSGGSSLSLNTSGPGSAAGPNQWIVNKNYSGAPVYPNTMSQDSTYGGKITNAPQSEYLHIYDQASGITNCNYDPTVASDRFTSMTNGICTLGMDSVYFTFFYLCEGAPLAYGAVYYSINNGPWIKTGQNLYNNTSKWKFEKFTDPAFSNALDLRFGFRWKNNSGTANQASAFAVDDIIMVGKYSKQASSVNIIIDQISPSPVCPGDNVTVDFHFTGPLCDGNYNLELSNSSGGFPGSGQWVFPVNYPQTSGSLTISLPTSLTPSTCYKIRINRLSPAPQISGTVSNCFIVGSCPNIITTLKPVVTKDTNAVCIGSAIDIPFYSTGTYTGNIYKAELSDSSGNFPANPKIVGSSNDSKTYDPALGSNPGNVSGLIPKVPPGCKYYIRIVSSKPSATGAKWGPFCIGECDITTNDKKDLQFCVTNCSANPAGQDQNIPIDIHTFNSSEVYPSGNTYTTQLLNKKTFAQVGPNGILGKVTATQDTVLKIHIPCKEDLSKFGLAPGDYYLRVVSTKGNPSDNTLGTIIRLSIGAPNASAPLITILPNDTVCASGGSNVTLFFNPYNASSNSTYLWTCNQINFGMPFESPDGANSNTLGIITGQPSVLTFTVQETNFGCKGPMPSPTSLYVIGPPDVNISSPPIYCVGDTIQFSVPFQGNTYYDWSASGGNITNLANNEIDMVFNTAGIYHIFIDATSLQCGGSSGNGKVVVTKYPVVNAGSDTTVCKNSPLTLNTPLGQYYSYKWTKDKTSIGTNASENITADSTSTYQVSVTAAGGCMKMDSIHVSVLLPDSIHKKDSICSGETLVLDGNISGAKYLWNNGLTTQQITVDNPGLYVANIKKIADVCPKIMKIQVNQTDNCFHEITLPNVITLNSDGFNDYFETDQKVDFSSFEIKIYNRWGEIVFESSDSAFKWDGKNKSESLVSAGVYYYIVKSNYKGKVLKPLTGHVTVIR